MDNAKVEIGKAVKGRRSILINGEEWGYIWHEQHGSKGATYNFSQGRGNPLRIPDPEAPTDKRRTRSVFVRSDSWELRDREYAKDTSQMPPLEERLLAKARDVYAAGYLRDPKVIDAERRAAADLHQQRIKDADAAKRGEFRAHAMEVLGIPLENAVDLDSNENRLLDQIVECMEWSQSR